MRKMYAYLMILFVVMPLWANSPLVPEGYFTDPIETKNGIIVTNEYQSTIYLIKNDEITELISAPGCGRFYTVSNDENYLGFKLIDANTGLQTPAILNLISGELTKLHEPVSYAGQVSFADNGTVAFTIGTKLIIRNGNDEKAYELGEYSNRAPISPDGKNAIFSDANEQLWKIDLLDGSKSQITNEDNGFCRANWAPDGKRITFESVNAGVYYSDFIQMKRIGTGEKPRWNNESQRIVYFNKEVDFENVKLINSDIYQYKIADDKLEKITSTADLKEMDPRFTKEGEIIYHTYDKRSVKKSASLSSKSLRKSSEKTVFEISEPLKIKIFSNSKTSLKKESSSEIPDWVHIHQVWDTRDNGQWTSDPVNNKHQGYRCCGATSAMQVVATYKILAPNPFETHGHTSPYGQYLSEPYSYNGYTYDGYSIRSGAPGYFSGAHGYMWDSGRSPHSSTESFFKRHGIEASVSDAITWSKVKTEFDKGYPYDICTVSLTSGHVVLAVGQYGEGTSIYCNDPYGDKNAGNYGGIRNGKNCIYDWGDANTGHIKVTPVVWGVTARYDMELRVFSTYPEDQQKEISTSSNLIVKFNAPIDSNSVKGKILLTDLEGNSVDFKYNFERNDEGILELEPSTFLEGEKDYLIKINSGLLSNSGLLLNENTTVMFTTGKEEKISGSQLNGFEDIADWKISFSGIDNEKSSAVVSKERVLKDAKSLEMTYKFSGSANGFYRVEAANDIVIGNDDFQSVGVWVFGDCSGNTLELWFEDSNGKLKRGLAQTITWSGWKLVSVPVNEIDFSGEKKFNSLAVRQETGKSSSGKIFFDDIVLLATPSEVNQISPALGSKDVKAGSSVSIYFNKPMNKEITEKAFSILPAIEGVFSWENNDQKMIFTPNTDLEPKTNYVVKIDTSVADANGVKMNHLFVSDFKTERIELSLVKSYPYDGCDRVSKSAKVVFKMDGPVDKTTLYQRVLLETSDGESVKYKVDPATKYSEGYIIVYPINPFEEDKSYKAFLKKDIKDEIGLTLNEEIEINFSIPQSCYQSGNIFYGFEEDAWESATESEGSFGIDIYKSTLTLADNVIYSDEKGGELRYSFKGDKGFCAFDYTGGDISVTRNGLFGMWIFGDFSGNKIYFRFKDTQNKIINEEIGALDFTGWGIGFVYLDQIEGTGDLTFVGIAVEKTIDGEQSGILYLDDLQTDLTLPVEEENNSLPTQFELAQNYPNPFNPTTTISYALPSNAKVVMKVYDVLGREVARLVDEVKPAGKYNVNFNANGLSSGVYFYSIQAGKFSETKKLMLLK